MSAVAGFASMTLLGLSRRRTVWGIGLLTVLALLGLAAIPTYDLRSEGRFVVDMGLFGIEIGSLALAVGLAAGLFPRDRETRTVMPLLAVPLSRTQYLLGRFLGAALLQTACLVVWCVALALILAVNGFHVPEDLLPATMLLVVEGWFLLATVFFFSFWTSPPLNAPLTVLLFVICQMDPDRFAELAPGAEGAMRLARLLLPRMDVFHLKDPVAHGVGIPLPFFGLAALYGVSYTAFMLSVALAVFRRRDLK